MLSWSPYWVLSAPSQSRIHALTVLSTRTGTGIVCCLRWLRLLRLLCLLQRLCVLCLLICVMGWLTDRLVAGSVAVLVGLLPDVRLRGCARA